MTIPITTPTSGIGIGFNTFTGEQYPTALSAPSTTTSQGLSSQFFVKVSASVVSTAASRCATVAAGGQPALTACNNQLGLAYTSETSSANINFITLAGGVSGNPTQSASLPQTQPAAKLVEQCTRVYLHDTDSFVDSAGAGLGRALVRGLDEPDRHELPDRLGNRSVRPWRWRGQPPSPPQSEGG